MKSNSAILFFLFITLLNFYSCEEVFNPEDEEKAADVNTIAAKINGKDTVLAISRVMLTDYPAENNKPEHQQLTLITMGTRPGFSIDFYINDVSGKLKINKNYPVGGNAGGTAFTTVYLRRYADEYGYPSVSSATADSTLYYSKITELSDTAVKGFIKFNVGGNFDFEGTFYANQVE